MPRKLSDLLKYFLPLTNDEKLTLRDITLLSSEDISEIKKLLKERRVAAKRWSIKSPSGELSYPVFECIAKEDEKLHEYIAEINKKLREHFSEKEFRKFSQEAATFILKHIAPGIEGMQVIKEAAMLQLFAKEPVHILLLGDPGTGKTEILRSVAGLHPISTFGLGSGTTGVGLSVTVKGREVLPGLLPMADGGICAIDELNLMDEKDRASLYNAMEKGFISYSKGGRHYQFDARVRIIATANPKGDKFAGNTLTKIKKQIPFDSALLSRFHLIFLIRRPSTEEFNKITRRILSEEERASTNYYEFIREYIRFAENIKVEVKDEIKQEIVDFASQIKEMEEKTFIEITPRLVKGLLSLAKASARLRLDITVKAEDINIVKSIISRSLVY
ncbi:MAG: ATP-binding protein [Candidatus Woesearchaeota archaeon]